MQTLVLLSGGLDSLACVAHYRDRGLSPEALFVDYGQAASARERAAAKSLAGRLNFVLHFASVTGVQTPQGFIPGRNALLLMVGLMHFQRESGLISLGIHANTLYSDCSPHFVSQMQGVFDTYRGGAIQIDAPFLHGTKADVWDFLREHNYPLEDTYSCENGNVPCGRCLSCLDVESLNAR